MARLATLALALAILAAPAAARAATVVVNDASEAALRQAIEAAGPGDTVAIPSGIRRITLGSEVVIDKPLTLRGQGGFRTKVSGNDTTRVLRVDADGPVTIADLGIVHGRVSVDQPNEGGAGVFDERGPLTLDGVLLNENHVRLLDPQSGEAHQGGGGVMARDALVVRDSWLWFNSASEGYPGAAVKGGGGIYAAGPSLLVDGTDLSDNRLDYLRGSAEIGGGGIYTDGASARVVDSELHGNLANPFIGPPADSGGAGMFVNGGDVTVEYSVLQSNSLNVGERIFSEPGTVSGAGIFVNGADARVVSSWLDSNGFDGDEGGETFGGAIHQNDSGRLELVNDTIVYNSYGVATSSSEPATVVNTIFAFPSKGCYVAPGSAGFESLGHNIDAGGHCDLDGPGDRTTDEDPLNCENPDYSYPGYAVPCSDNTAVIDAGDPDPCPERDVRRTARPQGNGCDIGALEREWYAVTRESASAGGTGASLYAEVWHPGESVDVHFEYGDGRRTPTRHLEVGKNFVYEVVTGLRPGRAYYYRLVVTGPLGSGLGEQNLFFTPLRAECRLNLHSRRVSHGRLRVRVRCDRAVRARLTGVLKGADRRFELATKTRKLRAWERRIVSFRVPEKALELIENGKRVSGRWHLFARGLGKPAHDRLDVRRLLAPR